MRKPSANDKGTSLTPQEFYKKHVVVCAAEARELALSTAKQANSKIWHQERLVRVTATLAKAIAFRCGNDYTAIIRRTLASPCYPTAAMRYGIKHEADARKGYQAHMPSIGEEVEITDSGFVVNADHSWLGASPDGVVAVDGVAQRLLEIKCPYQLKDRKSLDTYLLSKSSCLKRDGSKTTVLPKSIPTFIRCRCRCL